MFIGIYVQQISGERLQDHWSSGYVFTRRFSALVQIHNKNNMINSKITDLEVAYEICNQFDIGLNATYAKLSGKWNEVPKWSGVTDS